MNALLVNGGYTLMLCALVARDVLWLRGTLVVAQGVLALYAWRIGVTSIAFWNVVFVLINSAWVAKILQERRAVTLAPPLRALHDRHFFALSPPEFLRWWNQGRRETFHDTRMTTQGEFPAALYFILSGAVRVVRDGTAVTHLSAGHFVGEMSLITGRPATADVDAQGDVEVMCWPVDELRVLRARDAPLWTRIQSAIGQDLVLKIARAGE